MDEHKAFIHYQKSADMGNASAICQIGYCYQYGVGVEKDEYKAFINYQKSAEMGDSNAICQIGYCYHYGIGIEKDEHKAFINYQKSAEMGNSNAICQIGYCYHYGIGVKEDKSKAFMNYQKSAEMEYDYRIEVEKDGRKVNYPEMGNASGIHQAGHYYRNRIGIEKNEHKSLAHYTKLANTKAINNLGYFYFNGIGVEKDEHKAFIYYQKSADMGDAVGTYNVGHCYLNGIGVEKNEHEAFIYYQKSAEMGDTIGIREVGYCYRNGIGTARDLKKANEWYQKERKQILAKNRIYDNPDIDDDLKKAIDENKYSLSWIPYNEFDDIKIIGKGGFGTVYYAMWKDKERGLEQPVALKLLHNSKKHEEFIKELKAYCDIGDENPTFLRCFGISKDPTNGYILVLDYVSMGSLRNNLHSVSQMGWKRKLNLLHCIAYDLQIIHFQKLIHRDLHSGNILQTDLHTAYIADLGLSISNNIVLEAGRHGVYGILPYISPETLNRGQYTAASDIYSFGMIMWDILYGKPAFFDQKFGSQLQIKICCDDLRPIIGNSPKCYIDLMKRCWDKKPKIRPSAIEICRTLTKWQNDEIILLELANSDNDNILKNVKLTHMQTNLEVVYRSEFINYTTSLYQDSRLKELVIENIERCHCCRIV